MFEILSILVFVVILGVAGVLQYRAQGVAPVARGSGRQSGRTNRRTSHHGAMEPTPLVEHYPASSPSLNIEQARAAQESVLALVSLVAGHNAPLLDEKPFAAVIVDVPTTGSIAVYARQLAPRSMREAEREAELVAAESRSASAWREPWDALGAVAVRHAPTRRFSALAIAPIFREIPALTPTRAMVRKQPRLLAHARPAVGVLLERAVAAACGFIAPAELPVYLVAEMSDELSADLNPLPPAEGSGADDSLVRALYTSPVMSSPVDDARNDANRDSQEPADDGTAGQLNVANFSPFSTIEVEAGSQQGEGGVHAAIEYVELPEFELPPMGEAFAVTETAASLEETVSELPTGQDIEVSADVEDQAESGEEIFHLPVYELPEIGGSIWREEHLELPRAAMHMTTEPAKSGEAEEEDSSLVAVLHEGIDAVAAEPSATQTAPSVSPAAESVEVPATLPPALGPVSPPARPIDHPKPVVCKPASRWSPVEWNTCGVNYRAPMPWPKVRGNVIDFHCHLFAARHARTWFETARHFGIDTFVTMTPLEECVSLQRDWPGRIHFIAVPQWFYEGNDFVGDWLRRIEMFYNLGSRMAKFHMAPQTLVRTGLRLDSPKLEPIFKELEARGMMVMTHMGDPEIWYQGRYADTAKYGTREAHYQMWEEVLSTWTKLPWVGAHLGGNPEDSARLQGFLDRHPNLYLDCSATRWMSREVSARRDEAREFFIRNSDRILFGSDQVSGDDRGFDFLASRWWTHRKLWETGYNGPMPIQDPDLPADQQPILRGLALPDEVLQKLYHDNAVKVMAAAGVTIDETLPAAHHAA